MIDAENGGDHKLASREQRRPIPQTEREGGRQRKHERTSHEPRVAQLLHVIAVFRRMDGRRRRRVGEVPMDDRRLASVGSVVHVLRWQEGAGEERKKRD